MNKILFSLLFCCLLLGGITQANISDEPSQNKVQNVKIDESKSVCASPWISLSKEARIACRVCVFYLAAAFGYHIANWACEHFFGQVTKDEARDYWYDSLILALVIELAARAEGDWSIFQERQRKGPHALN